MENSYRAKRLLIYVFLVLLTILSILPFWVVLVNATRSAEQIQQGLSLWPGGYTLVTSLIGGLQMFDIPFLLTNGNPNNSVLTITMFIYNQAFTGSRNFNVAATASVLLLVLSIVLSTLLFQFFKENSKVGRK